MVVKRKEVRFSNVEMLFFLPVGVFGVVSASDNGTVSIIVARVLVVLDNSVQDDACCILSGNESYYERWTHSSSRCI